MDSLETLKKSRKRGSQYSIRHVNRLISQEKMKFRKLLKVQQRWPQHQQNLPNTSQQTVACPAPSFFPISSSLSTSVSPIVPNFESLNDSQLNIIKSVETVESIIKRPVNESNNFSQEKIKTFLSYLNTWAVDCKVPQNTYTKLLRILKQDLDLPVSMDARTVLKTKVVVPYETHYMLPGYYYHFGLQHSIISVLERFNFTPIEELRLQINVDGLPLAKSSRSQFWPILCNIENLSNDFVFPVGVYHGFNKPVDPNEFLKYFAHDFSVICSQGFKYKDKDIHVQITKVICDAPAKAFILNIKNHNAYFGCTKCCTEGNFINNRMTYPEINSPLRTDDSFKNMTDEDFHRGMATSMLKLNIGLVSQVPLDYMHLVCLGVTKRLLLFWIKGNQSVRFNPTQLNTINDLIQRFRKVSILEFVRKPRSLNEIERFKATEFRQFLLYYGPIILKNNISNSLYMHFMCLHTAMRILSMKDLCIKYNQFAADLLKYFVEHFGEYYGDEYVNYNVHNLIHLPADVIKFGPLDNFSCFKFENYMHIIKMSLKNTKFPLRHFVNKVNEYNSFSSKPFINKTDTELPKSFDFKVNSNGERIDYFGSVNFHGVRLTVREPNSFFILKQSNEPAKLEKIYVQGEVIYIAYKKFMSFTNYFDEPCPSKLFYCGTVGNLSEITENISLKDGVLTKCLKYDNFVISLIHST